MHNFFLSIILYLLCVFLGSGGHIFAVDLDSQLTEISKQQIDILMTQRYRNNHTPSIIRKISQAHTILVRSQALQTSTRHFNQAFACKMTTREILDILTSYRQMTRFVQRVVGGGIQVDVNGFVSACQKFNLCYRGDIDYSDEGYKTCKSLTTLYYNHAFMLQDMLIKIRYDMLGEGNFIDGETNNTPSASYDLLKSQENNALALDSAIHPATYSALYPSLGDIAKNTSYNQIDPSIDLGGSISDASDYATIGASFDSSGSLGDTDMIGFVPYYTTLGKMMIVGLELNSLSDAGGSLGPSSADTQIQSDIDKIIDYNVKTNVGTTITGSQTLLCETGIQTITSTDVGILSGFAHLASIKQNIINASVEVQYALEQTGLGGVVNNILQDDYPKHVNDTTLYEAVYGTQIGIDDYDLHQTLFGQDIVKRPSFDNVIKQKNIIQMAQSGLNERTDDLGGEANTYEQEAATCKKYFAEQFEQCKGKGQFKEVQVCIEIELLKLKKCIQKVLCINLFSVGDYLGATICRVGKGLDQASTKSEVSSLQEVAQSIKGPLISLKNSGKILPHKVKREFFETTLNFKLSDLLSFQIWHNSKPLWSVGDHKKKKQEQEQKNKNTFDVINKTIVQNMMYDKDKYSQSYSDTQALSQTPGLTSQYIDYSMQIGNDMDSKVRIQGWKQFIANTKLRHHTDTLKLYDDHWKRTQSMRDVIAQDLKQQAGIAQTAAEADQQ